MQAATQYLTLNKAHWNARVDTHVSSAFYDMPAFMQGATSLKDIELSLLGDVQGLRILHLQCHFGQDTLSLARMGAHVTGVDFSEAAIAKARELAQTLHIPADFVCCDVYDTLQHLEPHSFDVVFTSYGTIGWLPDLDRWAAVIAGALKKGGRLVFVEFHPVVWMFDNDFTKVAYSYFKEAPIVEDIQGTYADRQAELQFVSVSWNHSLASVVQALLQHQLTIHTMEEYNYSPYNCFAHTAQAANGKYYIAHLGQTIPMVYALVALRS